MFAIALGLVLYILEISLFLMYAQTSVVPVIAKLQRESSLCRRFFYFGVAHAISAMHNTPSFRAAFKKNVDLTINSYRNSLDGRRLNKATGGEAFAPDNGLYVCFADGFRPHESSHQGLACMHPLYMFLCFNS